MDSPPFRDAKLKIKWAKQDIRDLQSTLASFLQSDIYRLDAETDPQTRQELLRFRVTAPLPEDTPKFIGDAMQKLRTVLDYVAYEIVTHAGGKTDYVKFPVRRNREELEAALTGGEMKVAGADVIRLLCDVVQPYPGGNGAAIAVLHGLNITDKHFHLIPVVNAASISFTGRAGPITFSDCTVVAQGGQANIFALPAGMTFKGEAHPSFAVVFGEGQPFEGEPVVETLEQLAQLIAGTVQAVEELYLARE